MTTYREIIYDIWTDLKQNFADNELTLSHIAYWTRIYGDRLLSQHIQKHDTQAYLQVFPQNPVLTDTLTGRKYMELPATIFDLDNDDGVNYLSYDFEVEMDAFTKIIFTRTTASSARRLYYNDDEAPAPSNPYWYRADKTRLYILGLDCVNIKFIEAGLLIAFSEMPCDLNEQINFPTELLSVLQRQLLDLGRFILMVPADRTNDGAYEVGKMPNTKILSVNEQQTEQT